MKRFLVTEEERKHIMKLYEKIGDPLPQQTQNSPVFDTPVFEYTKKVAKFLNLYYNMNLPAASTGNYNDKDYNEALKKFMDEKEVPVWTCKIGDGYCRDDDEGIVTTKDIRKLPQTIQRYVAFQWMRSKQQQNTTTQPTNNTQNTTSSNQLQFNFNYPNDKNYKYAYDQGKWFAQNVKNGKVFDLSSNPKFKSSVENLNRQFGSQIQTSGS